MELNGTYIPPEYTCQWKFMTRYGDTYIYHNMYTNVSKVIKTVDEQINNFKISIVRLDESIFGKNDVLLSKRGRLAADAEEAFKNKIGFFVSE